MMTIPAFVERKKKGEKISMVTCYDATFARILSHTEIDALLVGDTVAVVVYGEDTTLPATTEMIARHVSAVRKGAPKKMIIGDLPFVSYRKGLADAVENSAMLMRAGANAVKLEGLDGNEELIMHLVQSGIPVMGHLGLTPQSFHVFGGHKVQAREQKQADLLLEQARRLEEAGCFSLVLECVPAEVAAKVSSALNIPVIGIGAGKGTDGQVLVLYDVLGFSEFKGRFVRHYMEGGEMSITALNGFHQDIQAGRYPSDEESFR